MPPQIASKKATGLATSAARRPSVTGESTSTMNEPVVQAIMETKENVQKYIGSLNEFNPKATDDTSIEDGFEIIVNVLGEILPALGAKTKTVVSEARDFAVNRIKLVMEYAKNMAQKARSDTTLIHEGNESFLGNMNNEILIKLNEIQKQMEELKKPQQTYANVTKNRVNEKQQLKSRIEKEIDTKQRQKTYALVLKSNNSADTSKTIEKIFRESKVCLTAETAPKKLFPIGSNTVKLELSDSTSLNKLKTAIEQDGRLKVNEVKKRNPMIAITSIPPWVKSEELVEGYLLKQNPELKSIEPNLTQTDFKFKFKQRPFFMKRLGSEQERSNERYNAIIEVTSKAYKALMELGTVCIDTFRLRVKSYISITQCYKCFAYGHLAKNCKNLTEDEQICSFCSNKHPFKECPLAKEKDAKPTCISCKLSNGKSRNQQKLDESHVATSRKCPSYTRHMTLAIENVDW